MTQLTQAERIGNSVALSPILEQNSQIAIQDEDGNEEVTDLAELGCNGDQNAPSVHIESSNDVHVGNAVTFNAPVTIYQNVQGQINPQLQNEEEETHVTVDGPTKDPNKFSSTGLLLRKTDHYQRRIRKPLIYAILIVTTVTSIVAVSFLATVKMKTKPVVPYADNSSDKELKWMLDKDDWGGIKTFEIPPLHHPVPMLIISHTEGPYCNTVITCSRVIRSIQAKHISQGYRDIGYNYLIGGDGNVYIGRGGDTESFHSHHRNHSLGISIVGDYDVNVLTDSMFITVIKLITCLRQYNILAPNYAIVAHNQTTETRSPGKNVYKVIKDWRHFVDGKIKDENVVVSNDTGDVLTQKWLRATKFCMSENVKVKTLL